MRGRAPWRPLRVTAAIVVAAVGACSRPDADRRATSGAAAPPVNAESLRVAAAAESVANARDAWNMAELVKRLTEAGLVVDDPHKPVRHPPLAKVGQLLTVGGNELQVFIYDNADARRLESAKLDTAPPPPGAAPSLIPRPHYIISNNLIVIHSIPSEVQTERLENVLTARHRGA